MACEMEHQSDVKPRQLSTFPHDHTTHMHIHIHTDHKTNKVEYSNIGLFGLDRSVELYGLSLMRLLRDLGLSRLSEGIPWYTGRREKLERSETLRRRRDSAREEVEEMNLNKIFIMKTYILRRRVEERAR